MSVSSRQIDVETATVPMSIGAQPAHRVLVVDDSRLQRKILCSSVKRWGFDVYEAESGAEALKIAAEVQPDLVLSDWMMPGMNGLEFCKAFRTQSGERYGYFILLTSKSEKNEVAMGLESGADDFLTKPVDANELRARIAAGERILVMQRELTRKNDLISETLGELQRVYDSLDNDLLEAKKLQQSLIRERNKSFGTGDVSLMLRSSGHVGGDLVGFFAAGPGHLGLFSIDVSGHGISSALMTARLAGYLSAAAPDQNVALQRLVDGTYAFLPPENVIETLNDLVLDEMETEHYFTLLLADVDLTNGHVRMAQAGHPHPRFSARTARSNRTDRAAFL
jgi:sigma-B regulation protein RsbU (phosphoserine phosphatase)